MINTKYLTYGIVTHCTLSCDGCLSKSELSTTKASFIPIEMFKRDVEAASKFIRTGQFALSGGEALLHKKIIDFLKIIKESNITDCVKVHTNGQLLDRQPDQFWENVDLLVLSLYPNTKLDNNYIRSYAEAKCAQYNITLHCHTPDNFIKIHTTADKERDTQKIYDECDYAHVHECHTIHDGKFYKCFVPIINKIEEDGVPIEETEVVNYLNSKSPLKSCYSCFGTSGPKIPHRQVK